MAKLFSEFSILSGSDSFVLKLLKNGGAGAITATSNISAKLLAFIFNNFQNASTISNFDELQNLQSEIRSFVFNHEPISTLKAFISLRDGNPDWNRLLPPLCILQNEQTNKKIAPLISWVGNIPFVILL